MAEGDITKLLKKWFTGDEGAANELFDLVYANLHRIAAGYMAHERRGHTLSPTALVHDAYLKMRAGRSGRWLNSAHFYAHFALNMRQILVDHARAKQTIKRGAEFQFVSLEEAGDPPGKHYATLVELNPLLDRLTQDNDQASAVFQYRHFIGLTAAETAGILKIDVSKVNLSWNYAKHWLERELQAARVLKDKDVKPIS